MEQPLISVVIPTRTSEYKIKAALDSMINQTYKNLEILVIDDHGANATKSIVEEYTKRDPRVQYRLNPKQDNRRKNWRGYDINAGYSARAYGFRIAKGGWITTQDADDASLLNRIEIQYNLAQKYNATMVTVFWMPKDEKRYGKILDVDRIMREKGEEAVVIRPETITTLVEECLGPLMRLPFHRFIPFSLKWFPYTRKLFYGQIHDYPGADNCVLFRREVIAAGINLRARDERTWGVPSGRGSGRDFLCQTAHTFKNNWSFKLPLYLLKSDHDYPELAGYEKYLLPRP